MVVQDSKQPALAHLPLQPTNDPFSQTSVQTIRRTLYVDAAAGLRKIADRSDRVPTQSAVTQDVHRRNAHGVSSVPSISEAICRRLC